MLPKSIISLINGYKRSGHEGRRAGASGWSEGRRRNNLVQRPTTHRSAVREGHRGNAQFGDPRPRGATTYAQSPLRLSRAAVDARLQRLRLRDVQRGGRESAAEQSVVFAAAPGRRQDAVSARRRLQQKRQVSGGKRRKKGRLALIVFSRREMDATRMTSVAIIEAALPITNRVVYHCANRFRDALKASCYFMTLAVRVDMCT